MSVAPITSTARESSNLVGASTNINAVTQWRRLAHQLSSVLRHMSPKMMCRGAMLATLACAGAMSARRWQAELETHQIATQRLDVRVQRHFDGKLGLQIAVLVAQQNDFDRARHRRRRDGQRQREEHERIKRHALAIALSPPNKPLRRRQNQPKKPNRAT